MMDLLKSTRMMDLLKSMRSYVESHYHILYLVTFEEEKGDALIRALAGDRKISEWNMARGCVDFHTKNQVPSYLGESLPDALENWLSREDLRNNFLIIRDAHLALQDAPPLAIRLKTISLLKALVRRIVHDNDNDDTTTTIFLVSSQSCVPPELENFITVFDLPLPEEEEISDLIRDHASYYRYDVDEEVADKLILALRGLSEYGITRLLNRGFQRDGVVGADDIALVIEEKKQIVRKSGILEMVSETGGMDTVGGLEALKAWLERKAAIMGDLPAARAFGVETPQGAMIAGMPGCGKSLTAKAASVLFGFPLLRLDIGALMGRYVGDSEANMRRALRLAETVSPCVLWVDELEKAFAGIGGGSTGAGSEITSRLFGYFLTWMQENTKPVFVLATANDVSALPPELLRKGRFDEIFYVDFPNQSERAEILEVHLRKRKKDGSRIDVQQLARKTDGFSGADLEGIVKDYVEQAFLDGKADLETSHLLDSMEKNKPHAMMMKGKAEEYRKKFKEMGFRSASG